jgi:hypothetical protein
MTDDKYRYMTPEQEKVLDDQDLWTACDELVRGYDITSASEWEFFWERFEEYLEL